MKSTIEVTQYRIEKNRLFIKIKGFFEGNTSGKVRLTVIFSNGSQNRRFPLEADCFFSAEEKGSFFVGKGSISLSDVFCLKTGEVLECKDTKVSVEAFASAEAIVSGKGTSLMERAEDERKAGFSKVLADEGIEWMERSAGETKKASFHRAGSERLLESNTGILISGELFLDRPKKKGLLFNCYRVAAAVICVFLLPFFIVDGLFAVKGYKTLDTGENKAGGLRGVLLHANVITKKLCGFSYSLREVKTKYLRLCYDHYAKRPVREDTLLLLSERLLEENSNMALVKEELSKDKRIVLTEFIHTTTINKLKFSEIRESAKKMAEARCILLEDFYPQLHGLSIRKETRVVQLWHACGSFKTFGFSRFGKPGGPQENSKNHRNYDFALVSGSKMVPIYSEAFGIPEQNVKALGVPRTDIFFQEGYRKAVREKLFQKYPQLKDKKVVLFAPTFRGAGNKTAFYPTEKIDWNVFFEQVPKDYFVILKNHPFVKNKYSYEKKWEDRVLDLTGKDNINDLLFVTDLLITDYSSSVFEAALLKIPMVFYVFDKEEYLEDRDIYYDFDSFVPGRQVKTWEEMILAVKEVMGGTDISQMDEKYQWFREEFLDALSGNSTKVITEFIKEQVMNITK